MEIKGGKEAEREREKSDCKGEGEIEGDQIE